MDNRKSRKLKKITRQEMIFEVADFYESQFVSEPKAPEKDGLVWRRTLISKPDSAKDCPWEKLDSYDWVSLLYRHPQFVKQCDLLSLDPLHLVHLISKYPEWITRFDLNEMDGVFLPYLALAVPENANNIPWENAKYFSDCVNTGREDARICRFYHYKIGWQNLLVKYPQYADFLGDWHIFDCGNSFSDHWRILLEKQPAFRSKCDCLHLTDEHSAAYYMEDTYRFYCSAPLFDFNKEYHLPDTVCSEVKTFFDDYAWIEKTFLSNPMNCYDIADITDWVELLRYRPQLASWCDLKRFNGCLWSSVNCCSGRLLNYMSSSDVIEEISCGI